MDHSYFRDKVSGYYDQGLSPEEQFMMEEHIRECPECQTLLAEYKRLDGFIEAKSDLSGSEYWEEAAQRIEARLGFSEEIPAKVTDIKKGRNGLGWKMIGAAASVALLVFIGVHQTDIMPGAPATEEVSQEAPGSITTEPDFQESVPAPEEPEVVESTIKADLRKPMVTGDDQDEEVSDKEIALSTASNPISEAKPAVEEAVRNMPQEVVTSSDEVQVDVEMFQKAESAVTINVTAEADRIIKDELIPQAESIVTAARAAETEMLQKKSLDRVARKAAAAPPESKDIDADTGEIFIRGGRAEEIGYIIDYHPLPGRGGITLQPAGKPADTLGLDYWRQVQDSLKAQLSVSTKRSSFAAPKNDHLQTIQTEPSEEPPDLKEQRQKDQASYFEAVYMVATLTEDTDEYYRSLNILSAYLEEFEAPLREVVKGYIKELED